MMKYVHSVSLRAASVFLCVALFSSGCGQDDRIVNLAEVATPIAEGGAKTNPSDPNAPIRVPSTSPGLPPVIPPPPVEGGNVSCSLSPVAKNGRRGNRMLFALRTAGPVALATLQGMDVPETGGIFAIVLQAPTQALRVSAFVQGQDSTKTYECYTTVALLNLNLNTVGTIPNRVNGMAPYWLDFDCGPDGANNGFTYSIYFVTNAGKQSTNRMGNIECGPQTKFTMWLGDPNLAVGDHVMIRAKNSAGVYVDSNPVTVRLPEAKLVSAFHDPRTNEISLTYTVNMAGCWGLFAASQQNFVSANIPLCRVAGDYSRVIVSNPSVLRLGALLRARLFAGSPEQGNFDSNTIEIVR